MKYLLRTIAAAILILAMPATALAGDRPLVMQSGQVKQLPTATTLQVPAGVDRGTGTDTTVTRSGAGDVAIEGNAVYHNPLWKSASTLSRKPRSTRAPANSSTPASACNTCSRKSSSPTASASTSSA